MIEKTRGERRRLSLCMRRNRRKNDQSVQLTLFSSWSVLCFNPLQPLVRTLVWTRAFSTPLSRAAAAAMIHITQLCNNCLRNYTRSRICEATAHQNHLPRWFHGCELECASNAHYRYFVNRPLGAFSRGCLISLVSYLSTVEHLGKCLYMSLTPWG